MVSQGNTAIIRFKARRTLWDTRRSSPYLSNFDEFWSIFGDFGQNFLSFPRAFGPRSGKIIKAPPLIMAPSLIMAPFGAEQKNYGPGAIIRAFTVPVPA